MATIEATPISPTCVHSRIQIPPIWIGNRIVPWNWLFAPQLLLPVVLIANETLFPDDLIEDGAALLGWRTPEGSGVSSLTIGHVLNMAERLHCGYSFDELVRNIGKRISSAGMNTDQLLIYDIRVQTEFASLNILARTPNGVNESELISDVNVEMPPLMLFDTRIPWQWLNYDYGLLPAVAFATEQVRAEQLPETPHTLLNVRAPASCIRLHPKDIYPFLIDANGSASVDSIVMALFDALPPEKLPRIFDSVICPRNRVADLRFRLRNLSAREPILTLSSSPAGRVYEGDLSAKYCNPEYFCKLLKANQLSASSPKQIAQALCTIRPDPALQF